MKAVHRTRETCTHSSALVETRLNPRAPARWRGVCVVSEVEGSYGYTSEQEGRIESALEGSVLTLILHPKARDLSPHEALRHNKSHGLMTLRPQKWSHRTFGHQFDQVKSIEVELPGWDSNYHSNFSERTAILHVVGLPKGFGQSSHFIGAQTSRPAANS